MEDAGRCLRGSSSAERTNDAPPPLALAASTRPPCASTIAATMASPRPAPARAALAAALGAPEALEQRVGVVGRQAGAVVAHLEPDAPSPRARRSPRSACPPGVCTSALRSRLASTWRSWWASPSTTAGVGLDSIAPVRRGGPRVVDRVAGERGEVDRRCAAPRAAVQAREHQQVLDQHAHARRPRPRCAASPSRSRPGRSRRPCGTARRSRGSRPAACAARATRRR